MIGVLYLLIKRYYKKKDKVVIQSENNLIDEPKDWTSELRQEMNAKTTFYLRDKDKAEQTIGVLLQHADEDSEIYGVFKNASFPDEVEQEVEDAIEKGAKFKILMRCSGEIQYTNAKRLYEKGKKNKNVEIHDFDKPIKSYEQKTSKMPIPPGNFRMIINSRSLREKTPASIIGIFEPNKKIYAGIFIKDSTFFRFMKMSFIEQFKKYRIFRP
jgi:hypothetical protein